MIYNIVYSILAIEYLQEFRGGIQQRSERRIAVIELVLHLDRRPHEPLHKLGEAQRCRILHTMRKQNLCLHIDASCSRKIDDNNDDDNDDNDGDGDYDGNGDKGGDR